MKWIRINYFAKLRLKRTLVFFLMVMISVGAMFAAVQFTGATQALY